MKESTKEQVCLEATDRLHRVSLGKYSQMCARQLSGRNSFLPGALKVGTNATISPLSSAKFITSDEGITEHKIQLNITLDYI